MNCPLCAVLPTDVNVIVATDDHIAVYDKRPQARTHVIVFPRAHFDSFADMPSDAATDLLLAAQSLAVSLRLDGYRILANVGQEGGQRVPHACVQVLSRSIEACRKSSSKSTTTTE